MAVTNGGGANISIRDRSGVLASDEARDFYIKQVPAKDWSVCFGLCDPKSNGLESGFRGGIREVVAMNEIESG